MDEMNKQNPENIPEEQTQQAPAESAAVDKRAQKKAARKAKKAHYKQLRKELREKKREAYRAKTFLGKTAWVLGKGLALLFVAVTLATVVRVNYLDVGVTSVEVILKSLEIMKEVGAATEEEILEAAPLDKERGDRIDASAPIKEGETWAIYMYIVGSDLEARKTDQLSDVAWYMAQREAAPLKEERTAEISAQLKGVVDTILDNGLDLPNVMFTKRVAQGGGESLLDTFILEYQDRMDDPFAASTDIEEIMEVTLPENVKIVLQPGGAKGWGSNMINPNRTQRFVYDSEGMHKVYDGHLSNMGNPQTLADFLTYCEEEHPADHTMVLFWNHGGAAFGYGYDSIFLDDCLTLAEMRAAFDQVYDLDEENPPVDVIGFDACLMASMEVAESLNGVASYLVACEETEPGNGWDYTDFLNRLAENPRMNPLQLSRAAADSYMDFYTREDLFTYGKVSALYSVLDLKFADDLYRAYSDFASAALKTSAEYAGTAAYLGKSANRSIKFAGSSQDAYNTMDLGLFMQGMEDMLQEEAQAVLKVLDDMVLYNRPGNAVSDATGITVYYPAAVNDFNGLYKAVEYIEQVCKDPAIRALYYYKVAGCLPEDIQAYVAEQGYGEILPMDNTPLKALQKTDVKVLEDGNMILPLTQEAATITQDYRYYLLQMDEDGITRSLGDSSFLLINENGDLQSVYDGRWPQINGTPLRVKVLSGTPTAVRYSARVRHNGKPSDLLLSIDLETQEWSVIGIQEVDAGSDNSVLADRKNTQLKDGDILVPVYEEYNIHTGVGTEITGESITWKEDTKVVDAALPDGTYMHYIRLVDARGDAYDMQVISFEIDNGTTKNGEIVKMP